MVVLRLLVRLGKVHGFGVVSQHINYGNRDESHAEAQFVHEWSEAEGATFRLRCIDEVKRGVTAREEYEEMSRNIRFDMYKQGMEEFGFCGVCVGHHRGDIQENVLGNFFRGVSLLELNGMGAESVIDGVNIWRPLLEHDKVDVLEFAQKYGIPYFKDTTPLWSTRGKTRNQLVPLLQDMYGDGVLMKLSELGCASAQLKRMINRGFLDPFWKGVRYTSLCAIIPLQQFSNEPVLFWKEALKHVCHSMQTGKIGERPLKIFRDRIMHDWRKDGWVALKKENKSLLIEGSLLLFRSEFYPLQVKNSERGNSRGPVLQPYVSQGTVVQGPAGPDQPGVNHFGPWRVVLSLAEGSGDERAQPALTVWDVVEGTFSYRIPYAEEYQVNPEMRCKALKQIDKVITDAIPIVIASGIAMEYTDTLQEVCVEVSLSFSEKT